MFVFKLLTNVSPKDPWCRFTSSGFHSHEFSNAKYFPPSLVRNENFSNQIKILARALSIYCVTHFTEV
jgi:hypothetical protein